jgi:CRISPR-associated protein Cas1
LARCSLTPPRRKTDKKASQYGLRDDRRRKPEKGRENLVAMLEGAEKARVRWRLWTDFGLPWAHRGLRRRWHNHRLAGPGWALSGADRRAGQRQCLAPAPQYSRSDKPESFVRSFDSGKIANQRTVLQRALRDRDDMESTSRAAIDAVVERLGSILRRVALAQDDLDTLRGFEGEAANLYFGVFDRLIASDDPSLRFRGRSRRPPLDAVNGLLSFLYTLLTHECRSAAETVGLDPAVGFLHRDRPSLVLGANWQGRVEHGGAKPADDLHGALIV